MKHRYFILGFSILIIICIGFCVFSLFVPQKGIAQIYSDGQLMYEINLSDVEKTYDLIVNNGENYNKIRVEHGRISVIDADCPDGLCVKQVYGSKQPIVCLPNRLVIKILSPKNFGILQNSDLPDAVSK